MSYGIQSALSPKAQSAMADIVTHIQNRQPDYKRWYAGISATPRKRLFTDHNVSEQAGIWIIRDAGSESGAREVERRLHTKGCKGSGGGGDAPQFVYAYLITNSTKE